MDSIQIQKNKETDRKDKKRALLEAHSLSKSFPRQGPVLQDVNFQIYPGELIHISGINGSGKSTLLKILAGLMEPDQGKVTKNGTGTKIGALIENPEFSGMLTLRENLDFLYHLRNPKPDSNKLRALCDSFDLDYDSRKPMRSYSIGMKEKASIVQAVMEEQNLILLDEPTRGLDEKSVRKLSELLDQLVKEGKSIVIASHDPADLGYTRKVKLEEGKLIQES